VHAFDANVFRQEKRNDWGDNPMSVFEHGEMEEVPEQRLWRAVIASTVQEWVSGPLRMKQEAEKFLFGNSQDYRPPACAPAKIQIIPICLFDWKTAGHFAGIIHLNRGWL
jgi:hypothetical protein